MLANSIAARVGWPDDAAFGSAWFSFEIFQLAIAPSFPQLISTFNQFECKWKNVLQFFRAERCCQVLNKTVFGRDFCWWRVIAFGEPFIRPRARQRNHFRKDGAAAFHACPFCAANHACEAKKGNFTCRRVVMPDTDHFTRATNQKAVKNRKVCRFLLARVKCTKQIYNSSAAGGGRRRRRNEIRFSPRNFSNSFYFYAMKTNEEKVKKRNTNSQRLFLDFHCKTESIYSERETGELN